MLDCGYTGGSDDRTRSMLMHTSSGWLHCLGNVATKIDVFSRPGLSHSLISFLNSFVSVYSTQSGHFSDSAVWILGITGFFTILYLTCVLVHYRETGKRMKRHRMLLGIR